MKETHSLTNVNGVVPVMSSHWAGVVPPEMTVIFKRTKNRQVCWTSLLLRNYLRSSELLIAIQTNNPRYGFPFGPHYSTKANKVVRVSPEKKKCSNANDFQTMTSVAQDQK